MKRIILYMLFLMTFYGCFQTKNHYNRTIKLNNNDCKRKLYIEVYNVYFGYLRSHYLTDSVNFRIYTGTIDEEKGYINYTCLDDRIIVEKIEKDEPRYKLDSSFVNGKLETKPDLQYKLKVVDKKVLKFNFLKLYHNI